MAELNPGIRLMIYAFLSLFRLSFAKNNSRRCFNRSVATIDRDGNRVLSEIELQRNFGLASSRGSGGVVAVNSHDFGSLAFYKFH
jgi:hypothetical protein